MSDPCSELAVCGRRIRSGPTPTPNRRFCARTFGCVRVVWNRTLATRHARYQAEGKSTSYRESEQHADRHEETPRPGVAERGLLGPLAASPPAPAQGVRGVLSAKRARYPRFKSRRSKQSATYTRAAFRWRDGQLTLAKTSAPLRFVWSWPDIDPAALDPSTVTVSRDPDGRWFVVLHAEVPARHRRRQRACGGRGPRP